MKRFRILAIALLVAIFSLTGCGDDSTETPTETPIPNRSEWVDPDPDRPPPSRNPDGSLG